VDERVRHRVGVVLDGDVVVEVDPRVLPFSILEGHRRQGAQRRLIQAGEEFAPARAAVVAHRLRVQCDQEIGDPLVERGQREKGLVTQARDDPPLGDLDGDLDLGLVARPGRARRQDRRPVVRPELGVEPLHAGLVPTRHRHAALELVAHDGGRHPTEEGERPRVARDPVRELLRARRLRIRVARRAEHHHEELDGDPLARRRIRQARPFARVVDEALLAGAVDLAHGEPAAAEPPSIDVAVLRVLVAVGMALQILEVEQLERHAGLPAFGVDGGAVGPGSGPPRAGAPLVEPGRQDVVRHRLDRGPGVEPGCPRPVQRAADRADAQPHAARHRPVTAAELPLLSQDLADGPHG
jgi:hypothetical protein